MREDTIFPFDLPAAARIDEGGFAAMRSGAACWDWYVSGLFARLVAQRIG
jgi:hypothetical protein